MCLAVSPLLYRALLGGLLALGGACGDDPELPPIVWKGEHVQVGTDLDLDAWCPGTLSRLDRYTGGLKDLYEVPGDHYVTYYLYPPYPPPIPDYGCRGRFAACYNSAWDAVFASDLLHAHEVVHAVSAAHRGMPHFFEEGAASYWGGALSRDFRGLDLRAVLDEHWSDGMSVAEYALAAHFTSYLVHTYGMAPFLALLRGTRRSQSREDFEEVFKNVIGSSLDGVIDDYEEQWPYCDMATTQSSFYECGQPALKPPVGEWMTFDLDISCADPEVVGPSTPHGTFTTPRIWRDLTLDIETRVQSIEFEVPGEGEPSSAVLEIKRCDTRCGEVKRNSFRLDLERLDGDLLLPLDPGRYVVRVSRAADDPGPVRFRWQRLVL